MMKLEYLRHHQRRTHGLPNVHHIVVHTCARRLLDSFAADSSLPTPPVPDEVPIVKLLPLALPELPDREANGLTDLAIFILRHTADPVRHRSANRFAQSRVSNVQQ